MAEQHYPEDDWRDNTSGGQVFYHCHRPGIEHGHLHLFMPQTAEAKLTHLLAISLNPQGLPLSLFTVNRWVAKDQWLSAETTFELIQKFSLLDSDADQDLAKWLKYILVFYSQLVHDLLFERDRKLSNLNCPLEQALEDEDLEIPSQAWIEWASDLDSVQSQWRAHVEQCRT